MVFYRKYVWVDCLLGGVIRRSFIELSMIGELRSVEGVSLKLIVSGGLLIIIRKREFFIFYNIEIF